MEITNATAKEKVVLSTILQGYSFEHMECFYMKTEAIKCDGSLLNCIDLATGYFAYFHEDTLIIPTTLKLVIV